MFSSRTTDLQKFFVAGINYKKTDAAVRGNFAINKDQYASLMSMAPEHHINDFFILSTCNRTEIFGFAENADILCNFLCTQTAGSLNDFRDMAYIKNGSAAVEHLFNVAAGLDSQILGDYEIVGQIKTAVRISKEGHFLSSFTERMVNAVLQASKNIKTNTGLSGGTVSVSFAAIQYIKENIADITDKKILLIGMGKIGRNTCKNLIDYLDTRNITLINRTEKKAAELALEMGLQYAPIDELALQVNQADIILVATSAVKPIILKSQLHSNKDQLIIDFSIPSNVEADAGKLNNVTLVNVDELSKIKDNSLQKREAEIPLVKEIIGNHMDEFFEWNEMRRHVPVLKAVKNKLEQIHDCNMYIEYSAKNTAQLVCKSKKETIQKVINGMAVKMRLQNQCGCLYIEAINEYIANRTN